MSVSLHVFAPRVSALGSVDPAAAGDNRKLADRGTAPHCNEWEIAELMIPRHHRLVNTGVIRTVAVWDGNSILAQHFSWPAWQSQQS